MGKRLLSMLVLIVPRPHSSCSTPEPRWPAKPKPPHIVVGADHETSAVFSYAARSASACSSRSRASTRTATASDRVAIDIIRPGESGRA